MSAKGDLMLAWAVDPLIRERGESGGAVTALLTFALEEGIVDAVVGVKKGADKEPKESMPIEALRVRRLRLSQDRVALERIR